MENGTKKLSVIVKGNLLECFDIVRKETKRSTQSILEECLRIALKKIPRPK